MFLGRHLNHLLNDPRFRDAERREGHIIGREMLEGGPGMAPEVVGS